MLGCFHTKSRFHLFVLVVLGWALTLTGCATYKNFGPFEIKGTQLKVKIHSKLKEVSSGSSTSGFLGGNYVGIGTQGGIGQSQFYGHFLVKNIGNTTIQGGEIVLTVDWGDKETSKVLYYQRLNPKQEEKIYFVMKSSLSNNIVWRFNIY